MTDPPAGRYQSQVLSFFSRQSQKWLGRGQVAWREWGDRAVWNLKVAATWGSQILLYPVYAVFQATRLVGRQLQQAVQQTLPRLQAWKTQVKENLPKSNQLQPPAPKPELSARVVLAIDPAVTQAALPGAIPTTDAPIRHLLQAIAALPDPKLPVDMLSTLAALPFAESTKAPLAPLVWSPGGNLAVPAAAGSLTQPHTASAHLATRESAAAEVTACLPVFIQGVASLVETRKLVLITGQNQILDILTAAQQEKLHQRIIGEVAGYWREVRLFWQQQQAIAPLPLPKVNQPHLLPPVRLFRQLMAWVQVGPVAISTNLFQEISLHLRSQHAQLLALAGIEFSEQRLMSAGAKSFTASAQEAEAWLMLGDPWSGNSKVAAESVSAFRPIAQTAARSQKTAIVTAELPATTTMARMPAPALPPAPTPPIELHRLGKGLMQALHQRSQSVLARVERSSTVKAITTQSSKPQSHALQKSEPTSQPKGLQKSEPSTPSLASRVAKGVAKKQPSDVRRSTHLPQPQLAHATAGTAVSSLEPRSTSGSVPTAAPDWIETQATLSGYVKHPLEVVLEWVDRILLWIEKLAAYLWNWIQKKN
jgi:hypothetical protein